MIAIQVEVKEIERGDLEKSAALIFPDNEELRNNFIVAGLTTIYNGVQ